MYTEGRRCDCFGATGVASIYCAIRAAIIVDSVAIITCLPLRVAIATWVITGGTV